MLINIPLMRGEVPRLKDHLLPNEAAVIAQDCHFENGVIAPMLVDRLDSVLPIAPQTLFKYTADHWFMWNKPIEAIPSPMAQDEWQRVYYTGDGKPKVTAQDIAIGNVSPAAYYDLGVPAPESAPTVESVDNSTGDEPPEGEPEIFDDETRFYIQTFVTRFGEESAPSKPSDEILVEKPGATCHVLLAKLGENRHNITHTRLYRTVSSSASVDYMLVAELPISQDKYADSTKTLNSAILETWDFDVPDENMRGLCQLANGICAGFAGNEVMFSEAYLPYAWPKAYRGTTEHEIVNIAAIGNSLIALTKGYPYIFSGVTPSSMTGTKLNVEQACVSRDSVAVVNGVVMYASPDGLCAVGSDGAQVITEPLMTRQQWQAKQPSTLKAWAVEGKYVGLSAAGGFVFDPTSQDFRQLSNRWDCAVNDLEADRLYLAKGKNLHVWQGGDAPLAMRWKSKVFQMPSHCLMSCARVVASHPEQLQVTVFADGDAVFVLEKGEVTDRGFRLPPIRATKWQIEVQGESEVERLVLASSMQELS